MRKLFLLSSVLLVGTVNAEELTSSAASTDLNQSVANSVMNAPTTRKSGFYGGIGMGVMNWGGSVTIDDGYNDETYDIDTEDEPMMLKVGYKSDSDNRIELYYKTDKIDVVDGSQQARLYDTTTFGVNYQFGISSLSTPEILPYVRVGLGIGTADMDGATVDLDAVDFDVAAGVYYEVAPNIELMAGVYRRAIGISSEESDATVVSATNGIEFGANYHF